MLWLSMRSKGFLELTLFIDTDDDDEFYAVQKRSNSARKMNVS